MNIALTPGQQQNLAKAPTLGDQLYTMTVYLAFPGFDGTAPATFPFAQKDGDAAIEYGRSYLNDLTYMESFQNMQNVVIKRGVWHPPVHEMAGYMDWIPIYVAPADEFLAGLPIIS